MMLRRSESAKDSKTKFGSILLLLILTCMLQEIFGGHPWMMLCCSESAKESKTNYGSVLFSADSHLHVTGILRRTPVDGAVLKREYDSGSSVRVSSQEGLSHGNHPLWSDRLCGEAALQ